MNFHLKERFDRAVSFGMVVRGRRPSFGIGGGGDRHAHKYIIYNKAKWPHSLTYLYDMFIASVVTGIQTGKDYFTQIKDFYISSQNISEKFKLFVSCQEGGY